MGRGPNGRLRTFVLIGCAPPEGVAGALTGVKPGVAVIVPADFAAWQHREHAKQLHDLVVEMIDVATVMNTKPRSDVKPAFASALSPLTS